MLLQRMSGIVMIGMGLYLVGSSAALAHARTHVSRRSSGNRLSAFL